MIKFGPSGNSVSFGLAGYKSTVQSAKWCKDRQLDCFEYSFGRGVNLGEAKAIEIGNAFKEQGVDLSVHAPYFINLASIEPEKVENSYNYILNSAKMMKLMQGERVVYHPSAVGKLTREKAVENTVERTKRLVELIYANGYEDMKFCPETMGKLGQVGTVEEIVKFCKVDKCLLPTIDFGHINAREQGSLKTSYDYEQILQYLISELGEQRVKHFHIHFSKIEYTIKGEKRHLTFEDQKYGPEFPPLAEALKKLNLEPVVICESAGTQTEDAMTMKQMYFSV